VNLPIRTLPFAADEATLEAIVAEDDCAALADRRRRAYARFARTGAVLALPYRKPVWITGERIVRTEPQGASSTASELTDDGRPVDELATLASANAGGIVHFGGILVRNTAPRPLPPGVTLLSLHDALNTCPAEVEAAMIRCIDRANIRDAQLTGAFVNCGVFLSVAAGVRLREPLQLLWIYPAGRAHTVFPIVIVSLGEGADVTVMERHHGTGDAFVCGIVDAQVGKRAKLSYVAVQQLNDGSQFRMMRSGQAADAATLAWSSADLGGAKIRNTHIAHATGRGSHIHHAALAMLGGKQRADHIVRLHLRGVASQAQSVTAIALTGTAVARQHERIVAHARARHANASTLTAGLLLSRKAAFESVPERAAKESRVALRQNVRVDSVDADTMFYLATRGIHHAAAMKMTALGFFEPAIVKFPGEIISEEIRTALDEHIEEAVE
jgi:Fe-S cluster assembly scaffold protein SufB